MTEDMVQKVKDNADRVFFPNLGEDNIFTNGIKIDKVLFTIPGTDIEIYMYGFLIAMGILLAMIYAFRKMKSVGLDPDRTVDAIIAGVIGAAIGARLYFVIFNWDLYDGNIKQIMNYRDGGLAIYGGVIGALLFAGIVAKIRKVHIPTLLDLAGVGFLIGQGVGRWGNFFNEEAYGSVTKLPWGMTSYKIMNGLAEYAVDNVEQFPTIEASEMIAHPCFLYESIWCLIGALLLSLYFKHRKFDGEVFLMYLGWYGIGRFFIEGLRTDSLFLGQSLRVSQLVAGACVLATIILIPVLRGIVKRSGDYKFYFETEHSKALLAELEAREEKAKNKKLEKKNATTTPQETTENEELIETEDEILIDSDDTEDDGEDDDE